MSVSSGAASLLKRQLKEIRKSKDLQGISCGLFDDDDLFVWEVMLMISDDCKYYGGTSRLHPPTPSNPSLSLSLSLCVCVSLPLSSNHGCGATIQEASSAPK